MNILLWATVGWEYFLNQLRGKPSGFKTADSLWSSLQEGMIQFITKNGGNAGYYSKPQIIARPHWKDVEDYLMGHIDFPALKIKLGC